MLYLFVLGLRFLHGRDFVCLQIELSDVLAFGLRFVGAVLSFLVGFFGELEAVGRGGAGGGGWAGGRGCDWRGGGRGARGARVLANGQRWVIAIEKNQLPKKIKIKKWFFNY